MNLWEEHKKPTDDQLKKCQGDYIGCELCPWGGRCIELRIKEVEDTLRINKLNMGETQHEDMVRRY